MIIMIMIVLLETAKLSLRHYFFAVTPLDGYTMFYQTPLPPCHYIQPDVYILLEKSMANSATFAA